MSLLTGLSTEILTLVKDLSESGNYNEEEMEALGKKIEEVVAWRKEAETDEAKAQADEALDILTNDIPITMKAIVAEEKLANKLSRIVSFGIRVAKLMI